MKKTILFLAAAMAVMAGWPSGVRADHDSHLYDAADHYRDAVRHFEDEVRDADYFNRYDEKLVDRLEDAARDLRSASRHPEKMDRLLYAWEDVGMLQPRVERTVFGRRCYPPNPQLMRCWDEVQIAFARLVRDMDLAQRRPFCAAPEVCDGQCGYHGRAQPWGETSPRVPRGADGFGSRPDAVRPQRLGSPGREETQARHPAAVSGNRGRILATPPVERRYSPRVLEHESEEAATRRSPRRDVGAAVVGSLVRRLLEEH